MEPNSASPTGQPPLAAYLTALYFALCFYHFGTVVLMYCIGYPGLPQLRQHLPEFMAVFNARLVPFCYLPAGLLVLAAGAVGRVGPAWWPRWAGGAALGLAVVSAGSTLLLLVPAYHRLALTGATPEAMRHLRLLTGAVLLPAGLHAGLALVLLASWLREVRPLARGLLIVLVAFGFYGMGTVCVQGQVYHAAWLTVGPADWLAFRTASQKLFFPVFIVPSYFPLLALLALLPLLVVRPRGVPLWAVALETACFGWIAYITAAYFVPHIQRPLWKTGFSVPLIEELIRNDHLLRGPAELILWALPVWLLVRAARAPALAPGRAVVSTPSGQVAPVV